MAQNTLKVVNPWDLSSITELPLSGWSAADSMLSRAAAVAADQKQWIPVYERRAILRHAVELIGARFGDFVRTAVLEGGKPWSDSDVEVRRGINGIEIAIEELGHLAGREVPMGLTRASSGRVAWTLREPIGPVVALSAFNHPFNLIIHQVIPAFAAGCPVIVKPSRTTPLSCLKLVETLHEAGIPTDWLQAIVCDTETASRLAADPRMAFLSFIGSAKVGWELKARLPHGAGSALEHGGAAPVIVEPDSDLQQATPLLAKGGFYHSGQVCVSVQRVYAQRIEREPLAELLSGAARQIKVGDPLLKETAAGPLITPADVDRVETWVQEAVTAGAKVLCGGERISNTCYAPTVLLDPPDNARVSREEIFGPVVCLYTARDRDDAIARANAVPYAFQASVFTKDIDAALDCARRLSATAVMVNDHTAFRADWMPFGGYKESGYRMGGIIDSMRDMTREKMIVIKSSAL